MRFPTRRRFLASTGMMAAALGAGTWGGVRLWSRHSARHGGSLSRQERLGRGFGATVRVVALHADAKVAEQAVSQAMEELSRIESLMSLYRDDSQLVRLNRNGSLADPDPRLVEVFTAAAHMFARSGGAFDITVQPLWELYSMARRAGREPTADEVARARSRVDAREIELTPQRIAFTRPGIAVTLNGIAQGYATDRALSVLQEHGIQHALVDLGELGGIGTNESSQPWKVGIQHPRRADAYLALTQLDGRRLATSGDYATPLSDDFLRHHVFDPRTGDSPRCWSSVSVVAPTAMEADALSTALMVLDGDAGRALVAETPGADALFCAKSGQVLATPGFPLAREV